MTKSGSRETTQVDAAYIRFLEQYPSYANTTLLDTLRATEYRRLDEQGQVYLDYTGGSLCAAARLEKHFHLLRLGIFGNPQSANPTSVAMTAHLCRAALYVLNYFNCREAVAIRTLRQNLCKLY